MASLPKDYEQQLKNFEIIKKNFKRLESLDWDIIEVDSDAYRSIRVINVLFTQFILYARSFGDKNAVTLFSRIQDHVLYVQEGEKSKTFFLSYFAEQLECVSHMLSVLKEFEGAKSNHGGARKGAGRPKAPTKQMRIPEALVHVVSALVDVYKSGDWESPSRNRIAKYIDGTGIISLCLDAEDNKTI